MSVTPSAERAPQRRRRGPRCSFAGLLLLAMLPALILPAPRAAAQTVMGVGAPGTPNDPSHAWLVLRQEQDSECFLVHLPPRESVRADGKVHGAAPGTVRVAARMKNVPIGLASIGPEAFLLFDPAKDADAREVWSLVARPSGLGDLWRYEPDSRLAQRASLPGSLVPEEFFGAAGELFVLGLDAGKPTMRVLADDRWAPVPLPDDVAAALRLQSRRVQAYETEGGFTLEVGHDDAAIGWGVQVRAQKLAPPVLAWSVLPPGSARLPASGGQFDCSGTVVRWERTDQSVHLEAGLTGTHAEAANTFHRLADIPIGSDNLAVVPGGRARVIAAWSEPLPLDPRTRNPKQRFKLCLAEVSADTGEVLYRGVPKGASPISAEQFRYVVLGLVALTGAVLIFVLRSSGRSENVHLDPDMALAEPGRRMVAFALDLCIAALIALRILGIDIAEVSTPMFVLTSGGPWALLTMGVGFVMSTVGEMVFRRTPGKFLTNSEVVGLIAAPGTGSATKRPALWQVLTRNLIKWGLPPVSGMALLDPGLRHQGERLTRTAVVVRFDPEDETGES